MDSEISRPNGAAFASVVVKRELSIKAKLSIYQSVYIHNLACGHMLLEVDKRMRTRIQVAEISFFQRAARLSLRHGVRSLVTQEGLGVAPLLLHFKRSQLR